MADVRFEIKKDLGRLSEAANGWIKELNLVAWNDRDAKYDIREWSPDHEKMSKGITLSKDELAALRNILTDMVL